MRIGKSEDHFVLRLRTSVPTDDLRPRLEECVRPFPSAGVEVIGPPRALRTLPEVAIVAAAFAGGAIAKGFLEELGKDGWRASRTALFDLVHDLWVSAS